MIAGKVFSNYALKYSFLHKCAFMHISNPLSVSIKKDIIFQLGRTKSQQNKKAEMKIKMDRC
jgi:hypothetical protein